MIKVFGCAPECAAFARRVQTTTMAIATMSTMKAPATMKDAVDIHSRYSLRQ